jgi:hypothetical protein
MTLHTTPAPAHVGGGSVQKIDIKTLVLNGELLDRLFRSTGHAISLASHLRVRPMKVEEDEWGMRAVSAITPNRWLPEEIDMPDEALVNREMKERAEEFGQLLWNEIDQRGWEGAKAFLEDVEAQRDNALDKIDQVFRDASRHNSGATEALNNIRRGLVVVKCAATIIVAGITLPTVVVSGGLAASMGLVVTGATSMQAFAVGMTYSVSLTLIKHWDHSSSAQLVLVSYQKAGSKTLTKATKEAAKGWGQSAAADASDLGSAERKVEWLAKRVASGSGNAARNARRLARAEDVVRVAQNAGKLAKALKAVPGAFFLWSTYDALSTAVHEW